MPHFTLQVSADGPVATAYVQLSGPRRKALEEVGQPIPEAIPIRALVDTGASCTCVDPVVMKKLQIAPTGSVPMHTPSTGQTPHHADQYDVTIIIPGASAGDAPLIFETISVVGTDLAVQGIDALIGRDILSRCILHYNGDLGFFSLCY
jgi:hypothetical protein